MKSLLHNHMDLFFRQDLKYLDMMQLRSVLILFAQQMTIKLLPPHSILITYSFYKELLYFFPFVRCKKNCCVCQMQICFSYICRHNKDFPNTKSAKEDSPQNENNSIDNSCFYVLQPFPCG